MYAIRKKPIVDTDRGPPAQPHCQKTEMQKPPRSSESNSPGNRGRLIYLAHGAANVAWGRHLLHPGNSPTAD